MTGMHTHGPVEKEDGGWGWEEDGGRGKHAFPMSHLIQFGFIAFRCFKSRAVQPVAC